MRPWVPALTRPVHLVGAMIDENLAKLRVLLEAYVARTAKTPPPKTHARGESQRRMCGDKLRAVVRPLVDVVMAELQRAGHEASTRDQTDQENAYPSVALSFTPRSRRASSARFALASALIFRYDPRYGVVAYADVKAPASARAATAATVRLGTIGVDALSGEWVETKTLNFVEAVLKAN
ncbi:MAG TPA: hypothetical protein VH833_09175 [Gemmatimonadales bacterium]